MLVGAEELRAWCDSLVDEGLATAAACRVGFGGQDEVHAAAGDGTDAGALFDLASLTKPLSATLALVLDRSGLLPLATRLDDVWNAASDHVAADGIVTLSLEDLLRHRTGFRRWMPLYATCRNEEEVVARLLSGEWLRGDSEIAYSDLNYMLWGLTVERALGESYWELLRRHVLAPLGEEGFAASGERAGVTDETVLSCALTTGREVELARRYDLEIAELPPPRLDEAQDGNCRFLGRPIGHAGVFGSAAAVWRLAKEWSRPRVLLSREMVWHALAGTDRFALGWYRRGETTASRELGRSSYGHDGFTGGTIWIDPAADLVCVVLCHRAALEADLGAKRAGLLRRLSTP